MELVTHVWCEDVNILPRETIQVRSFEFHKIFVAMTFIDVVNAQKVSQ